MCERPSVPVHGRVRVRWCDLNSAYVHPGLILAAFVVCPIYSAPRRAQKLRERDMASLRLRAACLLAVVGSDAAFLSGAAAPRTPAMRRAAPRPVVLMQEAEAPEPEAGAASDTMSAAENWASRQEPAPAAPAAAPVAAPVVAAVDQAELDFDERLAMLASQASAPEGQG